MTISSIRVGVSTFRSWEIEYKFTVRTDTQKMGNYLRVSDTNMKLVHHVSIICALFLPPSIHSSLVFLKLSDTCLYTDKRSFMVCEVSV
jgi:hypothetical protein